MTVASAPSPGSAATPAEVEKLIAIGQGVVDQAAPGEAVEAFVREGTSTSVRVYDGEVESFTSANGSGIGIRVIVDDRMGFAHAGSLAPDVIADTLAEARDNAQFAEPDEFVALVEPDGVAPVEMDPWFEEAVTQPDTDKIDLAIELERRVRGADERITGIRTASYGTSFGTAAVVSTTGIAVGSRGTGASMAVQALAADGESTRSGYGVSAGRMPGELDMDEAVTDAVDRATGLLGSTKPESGTVTLVLEPRLAMTILGMVAGTMSAERAQKGRALFGDRVGEDVASPMLSLRDDPTDMRSMGADNFDGEGLATRPNELLVDGVLQSFLHNSITARRDGLSSTGSAVRGYASTPGVGPQLLVMDPGTTPADQLLDGIELGLMVQSFSGLHSGVNTTSGDFSVGVEGYLIRNGEKAEAISEATVGSTLQRLLRDIRSIGDDLTWLPSGNGAASLVIDGVTLSGA